MPGPSIKKLEQQNEPQKLFNCMGPISESVFLSDTALPITQFANYLLNKLDVNLINFISSSKDRYKHNSEQKKE